MPFYNFTFMLLIPIHPLKVLVKFYLRNCSGLPKPSPNWVRGPSSPSPRSLRWHCPSPICISVSIPCRLTMWADSVIRPRPWGAFSFRYSRNTKCNLKMGEGPHRNTGHHRTAWRRVVREGLVRRCHWSSGLKDTKDPARQRGAGRAANAEVRMAWRRSCLKMGGPTTHWPLLHSIWCALWVPQE